MGIYINPPNQTKEEWLYDNGENLGTEAPDCHILTGGRNVAVCLVDNGMFTAAGIAWSERERLAFAAEDGRPKRWFSVPINKINEEVCGIDIIKMIDFT